MRLYLLVSCAFLSACAGLPQAVRSVPVADVPYSEASQNLDRYQGTSVRWGGVIIDVQNEENFTLVQVLAYPLSYFGRPEVIIKEPKGRFVMKSSKFLDPEVYEEGREITVAGELKGETKRMIGNKSVQLPLLSSTAHHLWPEYDSYRYGYGYGGYGGYGWGMSPYFGYGYYGSPYFGGGFYRPYW